MNKQYETQTFTDANGYVFHTVNGDENGVRQYTLRNGLTVYLAQNFDAPRIQTYIPVRVGSNQDPADNTGLAHYLEHMMFKGTGIFGTKNFGEENILLQQISDLYEKHKATNNPAEKAGIYQEIDRVSLEASQFALANEYDKILSSLGATGTNAHTWLEETVYKNNIPANELEKFLKVESNRFSDLVLRLFHTELETVYEEFNRAQDNDGRLTHNALMELLFPNHPIGQQTTLGKAEHLRNPSMKAIHQFFRTYYVPNNMAVILVGDLQFDEAIQLVDRYFGSLAPGDLPENPLPAEPPMTEVVSATVSSPSVPRAHLAWRSQGYGSREAMLLDLIAEILSNRGEAGLLDLNVNFAQKALYAHAFASAHNDYGTFTAVVVPREDATLDEGIALVLAEIEKIKQGDFPDWMLEAIVRDFRIQRVKGTETADGLATNIYQTFIRRRTWQQELEELAQYAAVTKEEIARFAKEFFRENYAVVYKLEGKNSDLLVVDKPKITPVTLNTSETSAFFEEIKAMPVAQLQPDFIDYEAAISESEVRGRRFSWVKNCTNDYATLSLIFPFGNDHNPKTGLAAQLLLYLGAGTLSADELKLECYKIGVLIDYKTTAEELTITLSALEENLSEGFQILHLWLTQAVPDEEVYQEFLKTIEESREAAKQDRAKIFQALQHYVKFGRESRFRDVLPMTDLKKTTAEEVVKIIATWLDFPFKIFYYGKNPAEIKQILEEKIPPVSQQVPSPKIYPEPATEGKAVFFNFDMVQAELYQAARFRPVDPAHFGAVSLFNEYFGSGLSSIVFQEIREKNSLAYSAYVVQQNATKENLHDYFVLYLGTQPDKLPLAFKTIHELMQRLPEVEIQFESARGSALKKITSGRISKANIYWNHERLKKLGIRHDLRRNIFQEIQSLTLAKLAQNYTEFFQHLSYNTAIMGSKAMIPWDKLDELKDIQEVSLEEIFGY